MTSVDAADLRLVLQFAAIGKYALATIPAMRVKWLPSSREGLVDRESAAWKRLWDTVYDTDGNPRKESR
jgi:hypothetical protein